MNMPLSLLKHESPGLAMWAYYYEQPWWESDWFKEWLRLARHQ